MKKAVSSLRLAVLLLSVLAAYIACAMTERLFEDWDSLLFVKPLALSIVLGTLFFLLVISEMAIPLLGCKPQSEVAIRNIRIILIALVLYTVLLVGQFIAFYALTGLMHITIVAIVLCICWANISAIVVLGGHVDFGGKLLRRRH